MNMEEFKERYEELKNNPMYQKYCSVLETKDKVINKLQNQVEKLTQENNDLKELVNGIREERDYLFNKLTFEKEQLQSVIDKAIKFIEENKREKEYTDRGGFKVYTGVYFVEYAEDLLEILRSKEC